ncbi:hypothetical protein ACIA8K_07125 [Catenuloplanes sp. NPDC051500]|uniref:hypothetical protein n=1 Tax=Catenuloplanes sp. NPDC051500 TaxID=3363959 RepID=UPI0037B2DB0E
MLATLDRPALTDPIGPKTVLALSRDPKTQQRPQHPATVISLGFAGLVPMAPGATVDLTGVVYDEDRQINLFEGVPAVLLPTMATSTQRNTTEDHQTWTDDDTDK